MRTYLCSYIKRKWHVYFSINKQLSNLNNILLLCHRSIQSEIQSAIDNPILVISFVLLIISLKIYLKDNFYFPFVLLSSVAIATQMRFSNIDGCFYRNNYINSFMMLLAYDPIVYSTSLNCIIISPTSLLV